MKSSFASNRHKERIILCHSNGSIHHKVFKTVAAKACWVIRSTGVLRSLLLVGYLRSRYKVRISECCWSHYSDGNRFEMRVPHRQLHVLLFFLLPVPSSLQSWRASFFTHIFPILIFTKLPLFLHRSCEGSLVRSSKQTMRQCAGWERRYPKAQGTSNGMVWQQGISAMPCPRVQRPSWPLSGPARALAWPLRLCLNLAHGLACCSKVLYDLVLILLASLT